MNKEAAEFRLEMAHSALRECEAHVRKTFRDWLTAEAVRGKL